MERAAPEEGLFDRIGMFTIVMERSAHDLMKEFGVEDAEEREIVLK